MNAASLPLRLDPAKVIEIDYTNHRGERAMRKIIPDYLWWGVTAWHPAEGWLLHAYDMEKRAYRDFAWSGINAVDDTREKLVARTRIDDPPYERRTGKEVLKKYTAAFEFHEWLLAHGYADAAREFNVRGLCDGRLP